MIVKNSKKKILKQINIIDNIQYTVVQFSGEILNSMFLLLMKKAVITLA